MPPYAALFRAGSRFASPYLKNIMRRKTRRWVAGRARSVAGQAVAAVLGPQPRRVRQRVMGPHPRGYYAGPGRRAGPVNRAGRFRSSYGRPGHRAGTPGTRWNTGGDVTNQFSKTRKGNQESGTGTLVIATPKHKLAKIYKDYPHKVYMKVWLTPTASMDGVTNNIGHIERIYSNSSLNEQHLAVMTMNLNRYPEIWADQLIGNSIVQDTSHTPLAFMNTGNTALLNHECIITQSRIPTSSKPPQASTSVYHCPGHYLTGFQINLKIGNACANHDQTVTVKLCRYTDSEPALCNFLTNADTHTLVNQSNITSSRVFETVWQVSHVLKGMSTLNQSKYHEISVNKRISCAYLRSFVRKHAAIPSDSKFGAMVKPQFIQGESIPGATDFKLYNNCFLVVTSKCHSGFFPAPVRYTTTTAVGTDGDSTAVTAVRAEKTTLTALPTTGPTTTQTGFAKFSITGYVTTELNVHAYNRST